MPSFSMTRRDFALSGRVTLMMRGSRCAPKPNSSAARPPSGASPRPHQAVQFPADLDFVCLRPVGNLIQPNFAKPRAAGLVDGGPRTDTALAPQPHYAVEHGLDTWAVEWNAAADEPHHFHI